MKIKELLKKGNDILKEYNIEEYILKCRMLLSSLLGKDKEYLLIYDDQPVSENVKEDFFSGIEKIKNGLPIQYVINKQEFMCLNFFVNEYVLIPQPDTEVLVQEILQKINEKNKILDLCTGSGAIGISIASIMKDKNIEVYLSDISKLALEVAKKNAKKNNVSVKVIESDLFENIYEKFDIIVSNPPYIETETIKYLSNEVKSEPIIALDGGNDGLNFYRRISKQAKKYLNKNGTLGLEIGYNQKNAVINILRQDGYIEIYSKKDFSGNDRIIICKRGE